MVDAVKIARGRQAELAAETRRLSDFIGMAEMLVKDGRLDTVEPHASGADSAEDTDDESDELVLAKAGDSAARRVENPVLTSRLAAEAKAATARATARDPLVSRDLTARDADSDDAAARETKTTTARGKALFLRAHP